MYHTTGCKTCKFLAGNTLDSLGTPICTYIREHLATTCKQLTEKHCHTVAGIILSCKYISLAQTVPIEGTAEQSLGKVAVRFPIGPLTLSLETCSYCIVTYRLLLEAHFAQLWITEHQVTYNYRHLHDKLPIGILAGAVLLLFGAVLVPTLLDLAVFLCPRHSLGILFLIVDTLLHSAKDFCLINTLVTHAQILLEEVLVNDTASYTHTLATDGKITLAAHLGYRNCRTRPTQYFLRHIGWDCIVIEVLDIMAIYTECRKSLLCVTGKDCCQIHGTGALCSVEAPDSLRPMGMHVHCLGTITPT